MFLAKTKRGEAPASSALTGPATLAGGSAVWLEGERRGIRLYAPGGYHWVPRRGEELLVLKTGTGEPPCALGAEAAEAKGLRPGEVLLTAGPCAVKLGLDGKLTLTGQVEIRGELTVNGLPVALQTPSPAPAGEGGM